MEWWQTLLVILGGLGILILLYYYFLNLRQKMIVNKVNDIANRVFKNPEITLKSRSSLFQFKISSDNDYLIKVITMSSKHELIITNSNKAIINEDPKNWKRSAKPDFVPGIKEFSKFDKESIKIVLIYPDCHNITKYMNESDIIIVDSDKLIDGMYYVKFNELQEFLKKH